MRHTSLLLLVLLSSVSFARADGMLDPGFGNGGRVTTNFGTFTFSEASALVVLPDGKAVAAGSMAPNLAHTFMVAARYLPCGALDTTFDGDGLLTVVFQIAPDLSGGVGEVLLQPDGRLVLVGWFADSPVLRYALARLNTDGSLDPSFGTGGKVTTPLAGGVGAGLAGVLQPDGRIVVLGSTGAAADPVVALARFNTDGSLDPAFGTAGQVSVPLAGPFRAHALALQPDGKILIAGSSGPSGGPFDFGLIRLLPGGGLDTSFDGDGLATSDFGGTENAFSAMVLGDGRIVLAGYRTFPATDFALVRYLSNGSLDTTFGTGGLAAADSGASEIADRMIVQPNDKLLVAGWTNDLGSYDFILARFNPDGTHDTTFGASGFLRTDFSASWDEAHGLAIAGPDRVLAAGFTLGSNRDFALARYIATTPVEALSFTVE